MLLRLVLESKYSTCGSEPLDLGLYFAKELVSSIGIKSCRINITGQNLINFYNPYPDNFMNPMSGSYGSYPNLRKWTVGVNLSF